MPSTHVIAFMGVAGAGKTSLVRGVAARLDDAAAMFADAYRSTAIGWPNDRDTELNDAQKCAKWFRTGCLADDYGSWPLLVEHLGTLKAGLPVVMPEKMWGSPGCDGVGTEGGEHHVHPARYVILEDAWALRTESRALIDMSFHVSVPLDVALARRLKRDIRQGERVLPIVRQYLDIGRRYSQALEAAASEADVILDGTRPLDELVGDATQRIRDRFARP